MRFFDGRMRANLVLMLCSAAVSFVLFEAAVRAYFYGWDALRPRVIESIVGIRYSQVIGESEIRALKYELKPDLDTYFKKAVFRTNSRGLRDREYTLEKPPGVFRVAVVGDSVSMPAGVAIEDAYHSLLEERLNRESGGNPRYEFINFAVGGYSLKQYAAVIRHKVPAYDPDLIMLGFCYSNDFIRPDRRFERNASRIGPASRRRFWKSHGWILLREYLEKKADRREGRAKKPDFEATARILGGISRLAGESGADLLIIGLTKFKPDRRKRKALRRIVSDLGADFVETYPYFDIDGTKANRLKYNIYRSDGHPNSPAHRIFADAIYDKMKIKGWTPKGAVE